jgi:hypothetical protein
VNHDVPLLDKSLELPPQAKSPMSMLEFCCEDRSSLARVLSCLAFVICEGEQYEELIEEDSNK